MVEDLKATGYDSAEAQASIFLTALNDELVVCLNDVEEETAVEELKETPAAA